MENKKELKVQAIENGTVIDHIPPKSVFRVVKILNLEKYENQMYLGTNLDSQKYGKKGIIKIRNRYIDVEETNKIALVAPLATIIEIKDYEVTNKTNVTIPDTVNKFIKCINPNCITNQQEVATKFVIIDKDELKLQCHYCEKITTRKNIDFI
ncbi:MAG: aspartate carbamoyltransferase regulatory subunit [Saprospiraceae bacterium]|nr:aspartate carbamoyltransferase regulatory subunit [Saprospiraceae bacterium]